MDTKTFDGKRWKVIYGNYDNSIEGFAVNEFYKVIQQYVPYILTINDSDTPIDEIKDFNLAFIGTRESNKYIEKLAQDKLIKTVNEKEGYLIKVCKSPFNPEMQIIVITGSDPSGVLYGVRDFDHYYVIPQYYRDNKGYFYRKEYVMFTYELPEIEIMSAPAIENRGLWTWGHTIYDYKKYIDHMTHWKMNMLTLWNDYAPINAKQIIEYAHHRGIKVIWGYTWGWGEQYDPTDKAVLDQWADRIIDTFEKQYAHLNVDGIYFQTFTEIQDTILNGRTVSELVTEWVNYITGKVFKKYPNLWIQFGLHATSIKENLHVKNVDPRVNITWEDGGDFPFSYDPAHAENITQTLDYLSRISELRSRDEDFGMVMKGCVNLDWSAFEHQRGPFILGEAKQHFITNRVEEKRRFWRYNQAYYIKNFKNLVEAARIISSKNIRRKSVSMLVEDGMWEEKMWMPVAAYAESLWNPNEDADEIMKKVSLTNEAYFG